MSSEAKRPRAGGATIMSRLLDVVVVEALRTFIETAPAADSGWLGALIGGGVGAVGGAVTR